MNVKEIRLGMLNRKATKYKNHYILLSTNPNGFIFSLINHNGDTYFRMNEYDSGYKTKEDAVEAAKDKIDLNHKGET
jgi:hypothetical protein